MLEKKFTNRPEADQERINPKIIDKKELSENKLILNQNKNPFNITKSKLSLALIEEILKNPDLTEEEKQRYNKLKDDINNNNFFYIFDDINEHDPSLINNMKENNEVLENPIILENNTNEVTYDIEFHKIGKTCSGMRKRYAVINKDGLFSSKEPLNKIKDIKELKNKTEYLKGAEIIKEYKEQWEQNKSEGEWHSKKKNIRIRINYFTIPGDIKSKQSSFFLYLDNEQSLNEVYEIISNLQLSHNNKESISINLDKFNSMLLRRKQFYTILKILSVKNKVKIRKSIFNKIEGFTNATLKLSGNLKKNFLNPNQNEIIQNIDKTKIDKEKPNLNELDKKININEKIVIKEPSKIIDNNKIEEKNTNILKEGAKKNKTFKNPPNDNYMPLITTSSNSIKNQRSLNDLKNKLNSLKDLIPQEIIDNNEDESMKESICFWVNGIKVEKNNENVNNFNLNPDYCQEAKYILFDKNKPEIKFKKENQEEEDLIGKNISENLTILKDENIHEISSVIYKRYNNGNIDGIIRELDEEHILEIYGPKISNKKGIKYKYKDKYYEDPEIFSIKSKTFNQYNQSKKEIINGFILEIIQSEIEINEPKILNLLNNLTGSIPPEIDSNNLINKLLFGYTVRLNNLKKIRSKYIKPKLYDNNICCIEHNQQYFIPEEYISDDLIIEYYCIPTISYSDQYDDIHEQKIEDLTELLSPVKIGYAKINLKEKELINIYQYPIQDSDINLPNSFVFIDINKDSRCIKNLNHIEGKDYSIGGYSYLETTINGDFIKKTKKDENISDEIKNKYFDIELDEDYIYLRPNEKLAEDEFKDEILQKISNVEYEKILKNKKFNFLPCCEKSVDEKTLYESENLKSLTEELKKDIIQNSQKGDWIYKIPELKVKLLTQNIGVYKDNEGNNENKITQYIFYNGEEKDFGLEKLTDDIYVNERIVPLSENCFNIFDINDLEEYENLEKSDNYQWKLGIKFKNELQMKSFLKLLILSRNNINNSWKKLHINKKDYEIKKFFAFEKKKSGEGNNERRGMEKCLINIEYIDFASDFILDEENPYIKFKLLKQPINNFYLIGEQLSKCRYQNSLIKTEEMQNYFLENSFPLSKRVKINKEIYKKGQRKIILGKDMKSLVNTSFPYDFSNENNYSLIMMYGTKKKEYYSPLEISIENKLHIICGKYELPFFEKDNYKKIYGCIGVDIYSEQYKDNALQVFEEINQDYICNPYKIILKENKINKDQNFLENYKFGLYEPNIFRRKILRKINEMGIEPTSELQNILKNDIIKLEKLLDKKCIKDFSNKFKDIQINFKEEKNNLIDYNDGSEIQKPINHYKKNLALKLLKIQRHQKFLNDYQNAEWNLYYENHNISNDNINKLRKEDFIRNKKETDELFNLIFLGIQNKEKREIFYKIFLDIDELCQETRNKVGNELINEGHNFLQYFGKDLEKKNNIIFSLIDNDCSYLITLPNCDFNKINSVKKIAKSFFIWAELKIGLKDEKDSYVYFLGILYITYKLYDYFQDENFVFLLLIGLSQKICHFKQQNPLFCEKMNYINLFGLVTKLILEIHQKKIYEKFQSLNFPIEYFISKHLSSLYADYFEEELMMRIFDILIFESGIEGKFVDDLQYLRILCAIPITLLELNKKDIMECESVSELESILNNLISHTLNINKFKVHLQKNIENIYYLSGYFEEYIKRDEKRKWDDKRGKLYKLINDFFKPIYSENMNYLGIIRDILYQNKESGNNIFKNYLSELGKNSEINMVKELFNSDIRIMLHIVNMQHIYNNEDNNMNEFILEISFDKNEGTFPSKELIINFNSQKNKIINIQELFYETLFMENHVPTHILFTLKDKESNNIIANFSYNLSGIEMMKPTNIILENKEKNNKYILELLLYKDTTKNFGNHKLELYKNIFNSPKYIHSNSIEEELASFNVSGFFFDRKLNSLINQINEKTYENLIKNNYDENKKEIYNNTNNIINENNNKSYVYELEKNIKYEEIKNIITKWLINSDISIEEIFYSIALIDKSSCINEKITFLYSIAQTKDKLLNGQNKNKLTIDKFKEMIYSIYKRFMVYITKSDINRMIDFLIKDERLFNIKYAFIYNKKDENKINDFIKDLDRSEPKLFKKNYFFEIFFDNIQRQLNIYLNYLYNNYNINNIPKEILIYILTTIINNSGNMNQYIKNKFNKLTLAIERENLTYKREFKIVFSSSGVSSIEEINRDNNQIDINGGDNGQKMLFDKIYNLNMSCYYNTDKYITFDKFKKIFLKLPYLSDLLRVSVAYNITREDFENKDFKKEFEDFKVVINYENDIDQIESIANNISILSQTNKKRNYFNFYFPMSQEINIDNQAIHINMNKKIKISDTIFNIIQEIIDKLNQNQEHNNNVLDRLKLIDKVNCNLYYYEDENTEELKKVKIGYFDNLLSFPELKKKTKIELRIIFSTENFNVSKTMNIKLKNKGYIKMFYNNEDFVWKKAKLNPNEGEKRGKMKSFNNYIPILNKEEDYVLAYNI